MKKILVALLLLFFLAGVVVAGVAYYLYRQVSSTVAQFAQLEEFPDLERDVRKKEPFVPPASEELTASQVDRFVRVQAQVRERLGARFAEFQGRYTTLADRGEATLADLPALLAAYRDLAAVWVEAKRTQVAALNEADFSLEEYRWVREQVYSALGRAYVDLDLARLVEQARSQAGQVDVGRLKGALEAAVPAANRERIEKVRKQLEENLPLASFGL
jgi:hypothetical protein